MGKTPLRDATLPPGHDEDDPYEGEDLSTYPEWWRENIKEFRRHGMRPYRPPRFADGELLPPAVFDLQTELDVEIRLQSKDPAVGQKWSVIVDGTHISDVGRTREGEGFTEYDIDSETFDSLVRSAVE